MDQQMYTYALVKSLFDQHKDFVETLRPFVLAGLDARHARTVRDLQTRVHGIFGLNLPLHVIDRALQSAEQQKLVKRTRPDGEVLFSLTLDGEERAASRESESDVQRRVNALLEDVTVFGSHRGETVSADEVYDAFRHVVDANLVYVLGYVHPFRLQRELKVKSESGVEQLILDYMVEAEKSKPNAHATIKDLVYGSLIAAVLSSTSRDLLDEIHREFEHTVVFLDANFAFSLLGLHPAHMNAAAQELYRLLGEYSISVRMLAFTVDEMRRVLTRYAEEYDKGVLPHDQDSVFVQLRLNGVMPSDALQMRQDLDERLLRAGVQVEPDSELAVRQYRPETPEYLDSLIVYKGDVSALSAKTDLAAIEFVARRRGGAVRYVEQGKFFFLTSDAILYRWSNEKMQHRATGSVSEVMLDRALTNILWLKNPRLDLSLEAIVAAHSRGLLHKEAVWFRVCEILSQLETDKKVSISDITCLLSSSYIDELMEGIQDVAEITPKMLMQLRDKACLDADEQAERKSTETQALLDVAEQRGDARVDELQRELDAERMRGTREKERLSEQRLEERTSLRGQLVRDAEEESRQTARTIVQYAQAFVVLVVIGVFVLLAFAGNLQLVFGLATVIGGVGLGVLVQLLEPKLADQTFARRKAQIESRL